MTREQRKPLLVIAGRSGTGKTHLCNALRLQRAISCTTRPPREGEVNGRDYYFKKKPNMKGYTLTKRGQYYYWLDREELLSADAVVVDPIGVEELFLDRDLNAHIVLLVTPWYRRLSRMWSRGDTLREIARRFWIEKWSFRGMSHDAIIQT